MIWWTRLSNKFAGRAWRCRPLRLTAWVLPVLTVFLLAACQTEAPTTTVATPTPLPTPVLLEEPTYRVERAAIAETLEFTGRVSPVVEQELFFRADGFVTELPVQRGDFVTAGTLLAQLDVEDLEAQLEDARLQLRTAELDLAQAEQENADAIVDAQNELADAQLRLEQAQLAAGNAEVTSAAIDLSRARQTLADAEREYNEALDRPWEPEESVDNYRRQYERAQEDVTIAQARYNDTVRQAQASDVDIQLLEAEIEQLQLRLTRLERGIDPRLALQVEEAQQNIDRIERQIANARLIAPFDGEILSLDIQPGDSVVKFDGVLILADVDQLEITADLSSDELSRMSVGQTATISLRNRPETALAGAVRQLPAAFSGSTVSSDDDERVRIAVESDGVRLSIGELATVLIVLQEKDDVLVLSTAAIRTFQGRDFVIVEDEDGRRRRVDIQLGIEADNRVEIESGLTEGELVIGE